MDNITLLTFQSMAELLGWTILHSIWQITLIALVLRLLLSWTAKQDATIRYALSISALVVAIFWSVNTFLEVFNDIQATQNSTISVLAESTNTSAVIAIDRTVSPISYIKELGQEAAQLIAPIMPFLAIFWFIGVLFFASRILVGFFRLHHFSNNGTQLLPNSWSTRLLTLQQLFGIQRRIKIRLSHLVESPITYQFFRPIILLPVSLFTHLSDEQIEVLLLHELAHIKRQDYLVNLLQSCIEVLFFYHPLIWWMSKQVRLEREHCCDDRVMNLRHNPMLYAQTLTQIQGQHYSLKTKLAMSATGNTRDFSKRIYRLFEQKEPYATLRNSAAALLLLLFSGAMMAFYPMHSAPFINTDIPVIVKDTIPEKLNKDTDAAPQIWVADKEEVNKESEAAALQAKLVTLEKALQESVKTLKEEKNKERVQNEAKLEELQLKAGALKKELHLKTQELKQLTNNSPKVFRINANKNESLDLKMKDGLLTLKSLKGKKPIIYVDNKVYHKWKIDAEGTLIVDIPNAEVNSINVFKENKAIAMFGPEASDGVVYINTKANPHPDVLLKEKKMKLHLKSTDKKPLVVIDGKVSEQAVEDIDPDNIATINKFGPETAIKQYGEAGKDGVIEIYTKGNELKSSDNKTLTGKVAGNSFTFQSDDGEKKPLVVVDGKVSKQAVEDMDTDKIGTMSILKGEAALKKYGEQGENGVVEVYTKGNEPTEKAIKKIKLNGAVGTPKSVDKKELIGTIDKLNEGQPLFIVDGKKMPKKGTSSATMEDLDPNDIATISVFKGAEAFEKYGKEGANGVVEIITKANKTALKIREKELKAKEKEMKIKQQKLNKKEKELKVKQKEAKEKEKVLATKQKAAKVKQKEAKIKQKQLKAKEKELKVNKAVLAGKDIKSPAAGLSVFPNPTRQLTNIQLYLAEKGKVKVDILNINGQVVLQLVNDTLEKGEHQFQWNSDKQPAGSYFVHFNLDGAFMSKQVVVKQ